MKKFYADNYKVKNFYKEDAKLPSFIDDTEISMIKKGKMKKLPKASSKRNLSD